VLGPFGANLTVLRRTQRGSQWADRAPTRIESAPYRVCMCLTNGDSLPDKVAANSWWCDTEALQSTPNGVFGQLKGQALGDNEVAGAAKGRRT